jgi:hypothetical protein
MGEREFILAGNYECLDRLYARLRKSEREVVELRELLGRAAETLDDFAAEQWSDWASTHPLATEIRRKLKGE